jgi:2-dehydro-3-deoxygluconokinase
MNSKYGLIIPPTGALLATFPGDTSMATLEQVRAFAQGASARIQR